MHKYSLTFTPLGPYFFGAENRKATDNTANYYLRSLAFPQQSTLLGAIRYFFLKFVCDEKVFSNDKIEDKTQAIKAIGAKSFDLKETNFDFGQIKSISEVFLCKDEEIYTCLPFDKWDDRFKHLRRVGETGTYYMPGYEAKEYYEMKFTNGKESVGFSDVFKEHTQSGNRKANLGDDDEDGFYKQQYYILKKGWSFGVEVETDKDLSNLEMPLFMPFGGENRLFKINMLQSNYSPSEILKSFGHPKYYKAIVISDTYYECNNEACIFSFVQTKSSRYLTSAVDKTERYRNRDKSEASLQASSLYEFIEKGSTFYFDSKISLEDFLKKIKFYLIRNDKTNSQKIKETAEIEKPEQEKQEEQTEQETYLQKAGMNKIVTLSPSNA